MTIQETIESTEQTNEPGNPQSIDENIVDKPPLAKLESLVTALTERIALLEDKQDEAIRDVPLREQSVRFANEVNANDGRRVSISGSKKISEIENGVGCGLKDDELSERLDLIERRIEDFEDIKSDSDGDDEKYKLPESTFSLFITHHPLSVPFAFAVFTTALSTCCLGLTLAESVSNGTQGNVLGIPGGVSDAVRAAQFFGAIVGVLMEDEIPQGLQLIANGLAHELILNGQKRVHYRVISSSFLRLIVGYLFLSSLFINVAQNSDVISIFYDVLALEFVENIDDTAYALAKKGFFGKSLLIATNQRYTLESPEERSSTVVKSGPRSRGSILRDPDSLRRNASFVGLMASNNRPNRISRFIYFLNAAIVLSGLAYMTVKQKQGAYRCNTLTVTFNEDIWEHAIAKQVDGKETEQKLLIYSYFSGIYKESGSYGGYPMYVEQNKNDGEPFKNTVGAEIKYCQEISAWVFMHPLIMTSNNGEEENECSWLMRSRETLDYDFINVAGESSFDVWTGEITQGSSITVTCNECSERSDCNYHGSCSSSGFCLCDDDRFGDHCEFELPCEFLATEKAGQIDDMTRWNPDNPIRLVTGEGGFKHNRVYNRPVYVQRNLSGEPYDLRKYDIRQKITVAPSTAPSAWPTRNPTYHPTATPNKQPASNSSPETIPAISLGATYPPTVLLESDGIWDDDVSDMFKEEPVHQENQYEENVPDFADWDDFFEMPELHDLTDFMEKYAVILAFTGSRYYGTMISPDSEFDDLFPEDYHAFWDDSFSLKRTFIISDTTFASSPAGVDFFEMRRRVNSELNPFVEFSYGPYGVLIPLVNYVGAGFFHCLSSDATAVKSLGGDDLDSYTGATLLPSYYPTVSLSPSTTLSPSHPPVFSTNCYRLDVQILYDKFPSDTSWLIFDEMNQTVPVSEYFYDDDRNPVNKPAILGSSEANACLPEGKYYFVVYDSSGDGFTKDDFGYNLRFYGYLIAEGWNFTWNETVVVNIPFHGTPRPTSNPAPSSSSGESTYHESLLFDITCSPIEVHISYDALPLEVIWSISSLFPNDMTVTVDEEFFEENGNVVDEPTPFGSARGRTCLPDGDYEFLILDNYFGVGGNYSSTTYQVVEASSGAIIGEGGEIVNEERFTFSIPFVQSVQQSPTLPSDQNITRLGCHDVRIAVVYDNAPVGVTWVLNKLELDDGDTETERLIRFFTATNSSLANLPLSTELCLEDGNYVFNIYDGLGDGICCNDGDGYYAIVVNDQQIAKGGDFEFQDTVSFSLPMNGDE